MVNVPCKSRMVPSLTDARSQYVECTDLHPLHTLSFPQVSLAVAKNHSTTPILTTPPPTPARSAFRSKTHRISAFTSPLISIALSTNRAMPPPPLAASSLSPDAPMWMPLTPPSSTAWRASPDRHSNGWTNASPPLSSSPLSMLFPPLLLPPRAERFHNNENPNSSRRLPVM